MGKYNSLAELFTATANAIRTKTEGTEPIVAEDFPEAIEGIEAGGGMSVAEKDVNFYDYDGTVLYAYTVEEAQALTEMPALPEREGLICQGWNWSLEDIKVHNRAVNVGAMYITDDGKTRIYITLSEGRTSPMLGCCPKGTVTVDWGDGTEPDVLTGTSTSSVVWTPNHQYASAGAYVISLTVDGEMGFYGSSTSNEFAGILRHSSSVDGRNRTYQGAVRKIEIGEGVTSISRYSFYNCYNLTSVSIPNSVTTIDASVFFYCWSLTNICIPNGVTSIKESVFGVCHSLTSVSIPNGVTIINDSAFASCYRLTSVSFPNSVKTIRGYVFDSCYGMRQYDFSNHTSVPTLFSHTGFTNIPADCEILVPTALYDEWIAATNWSHYASQIVAV